MVLTVVLFYVSCTFFVSFGQAFFCWDVLLIRDELSNRTLVAEGLLRTGGNAPIFTCFDILGELGRVPLESQLVVWLSENAFSENSTVCDCPDAATGESHSYLGKADLDVIKDYSGNFLIFTGNLPFWLPWPTFVNSFGEPYIERRKEICNLSLFSSSFLALSCYPHVFWEIIY